MKIMLISLGCDKNLTDSEKLLALLVKHGHEITDEENEAEMLIINTCCFIHDAKQESIETILGAAELKKGKLKFLAVTGCLATRYSEEIRTEIPEVDIIVSASAIDKLVEIADDISAGRKADKMHIYDADRNPVLGTDRIFSGFKNYAYLKIAEGCNKHCTYCVIPSIKGSFRSRPFEEHVEDLNFDTSVNFEGQDQAAAVAKALVNAPTRYGKHISLFLTNSNQ